ncbi:MAG: universal stress protein [Aquificae bacterium]|nr:universal stress protein [Aquificota bacterium]
MKVLLVMTDSYADCEKALRFTADLSKKLGAEVEILVVLEDVFNLQRSSVAFGMPVPPGIKEEAINRINKKIRGLWERFTGDENIPPVEFRVGPLGEEVRKFLEGKTYDLIVWACYPSAYLCKIIDELNTASLIIK